MQETGVVEFNCDGIRSLSRKEHLNYFLFFSADAQFEQLYNAVGKKTALYNRESVLRERPRVSLQHLAMTKSSFFAATHLFLMCAVQLSLVSMVIPRYLQREEF